MANKKGYRVAKEVKAEIIRRVKEEGISVAQAAKDAGVHETTVYGWLGAGATSAPSWTEIIKLKKQNKELFEVIGELTIQLSQAKKRIEQGEKRIRHGKSHGRLPVIALLRSNAGQKRLGTESSDGRRITKSIRPTVRGGWRRPWA